MVGDKYDIVGIGNAIVDILARVEESYLLDNSLTKGAMTLIDAKQAESLYDKLPPAREVSGGSAANTIVGAALFGSKTAFLGKVKDDTLGKVFSHDIRQSGVHFPSVPTSEGEPTARCIIAVTSDAERTMATYLGAAGLFTKDDIDADLIKKAKILYIEGYLWDDATTKEAIEYSLGIAKEAGVSVSLSLSDPFCVDRHRGEFLRLIEEYVDILFCNEDELKSLFEDDNFDSALAKISDRSSVVVVTRGADGAVVIDDDGKVEVAAMSDINVIDTTGAGDMFAAGFLHGYCKGLGVEQCAKEGVLAAGRVIQQFGARIEDSSDILASA